MADGPSSVPEPVEGQGGDILNQGIGEESGWLKNKMDKTVFNKKSKKKLRQHLRNNMTEPEIILCSYLKNKQINGFKFRRQYSVGEFIIDFYCPELKLGVELDGSGHAYQEKKLQDIKRSKEISQYGIEIMRFGNSDIYLDAPAVASTIYEKTVDLSKTK